jgi:hypothetical protein
MPNKISNSSMRLTEIDNALRDHNHRTCKRILKTMRKNRGGSEKLHSGISGLSA